MKTPENELLTSSYRSKENLSWRWTQRTGAPIAALALALTGCTDSHKETPTTPATETVYVTPTPEATEISPEPQIEGSTEEPSPAIDTDILIPEELVEISILTDRHNHHIEGGTYGITGSFHHSSEVEVGGEEMEGAHCLVEISDDAGQIIHDEQKPCDLHTRFDAEENAPTDFPASREEFSVDITYHIQSHDGAEANIIAEESKTVSFVER